MHGLEGASQQQNDDRRRKREACLHSRDLWNLPGGATSDECFEIVKAKTEAKRAKVDAFKAAKASRMEGKQVRMAANLALGAQVVASLTHDAQLVKLKVPALVAALAFKGVNACNGVKKAAMIELLRSKLMLPNDGDAPQLPRVDVDLLFTLSCRVM